MRKNKTWLAALTLAVGVSAAAEDRVLLWGDTHLHSSYSFDAFLNGNQSSDPNTAYRFAKGLPVIHPYNRTRVQIDTPLDFLVVSDHAEFYGGIRDIYRDGIQDPDPGIIERLVYWYTENQIRDAIDTETGPDFFVGVLPQNQDPREAAANWTEQANATVPGGDVSARRAWARMLEYAEAHNDPGTFTTLVGWEWTSNPGGANLHRVVLTDADKDAAESFLPFGSTDSPYPEDLWAWMSKTGEEIGARFVAIPHNSNISKGLMFEEHTLRGEKIDADYAERRSQAEPIVEITQIKGDSETHPDLSPSDPFADFEVYPFYIQQERTAEYTAHPGDFVRSALIRGLQIENQIGVNPFQLGVIGSTDSHTSLSSAEEPNFWGKMAFDSIPERKAGNALGIGPTGWSMQAGGLAAIWATENSRTAIVDAMQRREVYATTGPRIRLHLAADNGGDSVPMGGELADNGSPPTLTISAEKDPKSGNLDRVQVIKGWVDADGSRRERIYNVAWSGDRTMSADGTLPPVGNTVDLATGSYENSIGAQSLNATWQDPDYQAGQRAFYYVRVLEIPTPRHSLLDALALGLEQASAGPNTIQERAYSSAIWLRP